MKNLSVSKIAVEMNNISKSFGGIKALDNVNVSFFDGEIHALLGENGAGKSTILKILRGIYNPDIGQITIDKNTFDNLTPQKAKKYGIGMIFQEMSLIQSLTVAENIYLGNEPITRFGFIDDNLLIKNTAKIFNSMGININPKEKLYNLSTGQQQLTEIAKTLSQDAKILILDEPTSALTTSEVKILFELLSKLKSEGKCIIYVSHRMDEIFQIADKITVLRDGKLINTKKINEHTLQTLISDIMGKNTKNLSDFKKEQNTGSEVILKVKNLSSLSKGGNYNFELYKGEVLGIAGLLGSGRSRIARLLFGLESINSGKIIYNNKDMIIKDTTESKKQKIALIPEDRRLQGLILNHSIKSNIELPNLDFYTNYSFVNDYKSNQDAQKVINDLNIKTLDKNDLVTSLSGGNQQKVVIGKWKISDPEILILDEATAGIDIGSKVEVLNLVNSLSQEGKSIIFISSELSELIAISDRIAIISDGEIKKIISKNDLNSKNQTDITPEQQLQFLIQTSNIENKSNYAIN